MFTTREEGRKSAPDYRQLWFAAAHQWILISVNRKDFIAHHGAWLLWSHEWGVRPQHAGILLIPHVPAYDYEYQRLATIIDRHLRDPEMQFVNSIYEWRRAGWVRSPRP